MARVNRIDWLTVAVSAILWCSAAQAGVAVFDQQAKLLPGDGASDDSFGYSVAVDGETVIVGARYDDDNGSGSGTAYLFSKVGSTWSQAAKLLPDDGAASDYFGRSVAVDGGAAVVGAYRDDDLGNASGSAYVFQQTDSGWDQVAKLLPGDGQADDLFGYAVSLSGRTALVGAYGNGSGSAYVFEDSGAGWQQTAKLVPDDGADDDRFGYTVAINGDVAVVGARFDDDNGTDSGSAYVFRRNDAAWQQVAKLLPDDGAEKDYFGVSVAVDGTTAVIGAYRDDDMGSNSGSAYVMVIPEPGTLLLLAAAGACLWAVTKLK